MHAFARPHARKSWLPNLAALIQLLLLLGVPEFIDGADVSFYLVAKGEHLVQTNSGSPAVASSKPYRFDALVGLSASNSVFSATVQELPAGTINALALDPTIGTKLSFENKLASLSALNTAYPDGDFALAINTAHEGTKNLTLHLSGNAFPSSPPHVSNFDAAQTIDPASPFTITWDAFPGGTANDYIQLQIQDTNSGAPIFATADPAQPGSLNGLATSLAVPAGTLAQGRGYDVTLLFAKVTAYHTNSYPSVPGLAAYYLQTKFSIGTTGTPIVDATEYLIFKQVNYVQNDTGAPVLKSGSPWLFIGSVGASAPNVVLSAQITLPNSITQTLPLIDPTDFLLQVGYSTEGQLDAAYPVGTYNCILQTVHDGGKNLPLNVPTHTYPPAPHVSNFTGAQSVDAAADFVLTWDPFNDNTTGVNLIVVVVLDATGNTVFPPADAGPLAGTATSVLIPANTLSVGQTYSARVLFRKRTTKDTTTYPGSLGLVEFRSRTAFDLITQPPTPPRLIALAPNQDGFFQLQLIGQTNRTYVLEALADLNAPPWVPVATQQLSTASFTFVDSQSTNFPHRFYRAAQVQ